MNSEKENNEDDDQDDFLLKNIENLNLLFSIINHELLKIDLIVLE